MEIVEGFFFVAGMALGIGITIYAVRQEEDDAGSDFDDNDRNGKH